MQPHVEITPLLMNWRQGNEQALAELLPIVYQELRKIAATMTPLTQAIYTSSN
jgi:hypothetical protein